MNKKKSLEMVQLALLSALVVLLSFVPNIGYIKLPILAVQATTVHIPVIVGSIILGPKAGGVLGGIFGLTSLINNTTQPGIISFCFSPFISLGDGLSGNLLSLLICLVPRILCGILPYYVCRVMMNLGKCSGIKDKFSYLAAGLAGSMTNTILVMGMIYFFFGRQYAAAKGIAPDAVFGVILSVVAINGTLEAITAALLSSAAVSAMRKTKLITL